MTRQRSQTGRPAVAEDGRVRRLCPNQRNKSDRKENTCQPQLCSMPAAPFQPILMAIARPIPLDAPVTRATLPSSDMDFLRSCADGGPDVPTTDPEF